VLTVECRTNARYPLKAWSEPRSWAIQWWKFYIEYEWNASKVHLDHYFDDASPTHDDLTEAQDVCLACVERMDRGQFDLETFITELREWKRVCAPPSAPLRHNKGVQADACTPALLTRWA